MSDFIPPRRLGVGFTYSQGLRATVDAVRDLIDFFEISPDLLCRERSVEGRRHLDFQPALLNDALDAIKDRPVVVHGLNLSIGSASGWNESYIDLLDAFRTLRDFPWHSEHLGFMLATGPGGQEFHTGIPLPLPFTAEAADLIASRASSLANRYGVPFLIENLTYYLPDLPADPGWDEVVFLNEISERSGCGLLLDLYNFHCNAVNFGFDPFDALSRLRLDRVVEVHLAGGASHDGFVLDVHSDAIPEPVWDLFAWVAPRSENLAGVVYELLEQALIVVGTDGVARQLERVHQVWDRGPACRSDGAVHVAS